MSFKHQVDELGKLERELVLKRVTVVATLAVILQIAVSYGWVTPDVSAHVVTWINRGIDIAALFAGTAVVRKAVTPADPTLQPISSNGLPLVEQGADSASSSKPSGEPVAIAAAPELATVVDVPAEDVEGPTEAYAVDAPTA
jgi:hypothetical protein